MTRLAFLAQAVVEADSSLSPLPRFLAALIGLVVLVLGYLVARRILGSRSQEIITHTPQQIDVETLCEQGPASQGPALEVYHVPVQLGLIVLAPLGRAARLPSSGELPRLVDRFLPGLMDILANQQPRFEAWPPQLSAEGFVQSFFSHARLPGQRGLGTPWCSLAGKATSADGPFLLGLVCRTADPNDFGQISVAPVGKWRDVLSVRK